MPPRLQAPGHRLSPLDPYLPDTNTTIESPFRQLRDPKVESSPRQEISPADLCPRVGGTKR